MPKGYFLCGCSVDDEHTAAFHDQAGMKVCAEHNQREYGWRSPTRTVEMHTPHTKEVEYKEVPDYAESMYRIRRDSDRT